MFLIYIKNFLTKKIVNKSLSNVKLVSTASKIKTIGIIFDDNFFHARDAFVGELVHHGIAKDSIKMLVFKDKIKKNEVFDFPTFCNSDLSWTATFSKLDVVNFANEKFDLLINYYDVEKIPLLLISNESKASFKVGFSSIDKRLNHFLIDTKTEKFEVYIDELFKYLKILNKI